MKIFILRIAHIHWPHLFEKVKSIVAIFSCSSTFLPIHVVLALIFAKTIAPHGMTSLILLF